MLEFRSAVSPRLADAVARAARRVGLPLSTLELLTQEPRVACAFLAAEARGQAREFVAALDVAALEAALRARTARVHEDVPPAAALAF